MKFLACTFRITLLILITFSSINLIAQTKKTKKLKTIHATDSPFVSLKTKQYIKDTLFKAYLQKCKKEKSLYADAYKIVVEKVSGSLQIRYMNYNNEPAYAPDYQIPSANDFIEGDLNNDNYNDLVVSVYHSQNGRPRLDIYCYITNNKKLALFKMYTGRGLGICEDRADSSGRFFPSKIEKGLFIGVTDCYKSGDPGCCPSLQMVSYFKFENGLKFVRQEKKTSL